MAWKVELDPGARREIGKLDDKTSRRILAFLRDRLSSMDNPRAIGQPLRHNKHQRFWRYRVGDYRIVATIDDHASQIIVLRVGHRRDIYQR